MAIEFNCPFCTAAIRVADTAAGKIGRCPKCNTRLRVPQPVGPGDASGRPPSAAPPHPEPDPAVPTQPEVPPDKPLASAGPGDLPDIPDFTALADSAGESFVAPEVTDSPAEPTIPLIDVGDAAAEPIHQRVARRSQTNWHALLVPLICSLILVIAGVGYWWMHRETLTGELTGERMPVGTTVSDSIQRFVPDVSTELWQAALTGLREDPVVIQSDLIVLEIRGAGRALEVSLYAGRDADLVRVDVRRNPVVNQFCIDAAETLDDDRSAEFKAATTQFLRDWDNAAASGMLMGNGREYRDSVGINALVDGLGYHSAALVGNKLYPCVSADQDGRLYFIVPHDVSKFLITERKSPEKPSVFPTEYALTVNVVTPAVETPEPATENAPDESTDAEPADESSMEMPAPDETGDDEPGSSPGQG